MLRNADTIRGNKLGAIDGDIGKVTDLYFDDLTWKVRYVVVRTAGWMEEKRVIVTPRRIMGVDEERKIVEANLTKEEVKSSPPAETDRPLSECMEILSFPHHFWPPAFDVDGCDDTVDTHLRSMEETLGYTVAATDGDIGHVSGFIVDDSDWTVRYVIVDTRNLWPGKHVLMSQEWLEEIDWTGNKMRANLSRAAIKESPEFDSHAQVTRDYEVGLCRFYNREGYWTREPCADDEPAEGGPVG